MSSTVTILNETSKVLAPILACCVYVAILFGSTWEKAAIDLQLNHASIKNYYCDSASGRLTNPALCPELATSHSWFNNIGSYIIIVLIALAMLILVTMAVLLAVYMKWYKCLECYFYLPSLVTFLILCPLVYKQLIKSLAPKDALDLITSAYLLWNFTIMGMISIFHKCLSAPIILEQFFLVHNAAILAIVVVWLLPGISTYIFLIAIVVWDLFTVLAPCGPLKMIINMAQSEGIEDMPGLIYATGRDQKTKQEDLLKEEQQKQEQREAEMTKRNLDQILDDSDTQTVRSPIRDAPQIPTKKTVDTIDEFESNVNMGLGDFVVYGILVASSFKSSTNNQDYYALIGVILCILVGVIITFSLLATTKRALPALPISISLGLIILPISNRFVPQLADSLAASQYFV